ncbi:hypothetical protein PACTADRAFT_86518 [Pachysolen tannophilus NRRL Y-2460]|uniref:Protein HRI1 n=1 Tax=Pachysolen tannophilus NRRL Y-2460 TaxID=669874 RepID=A0A1E4TRG3_PACTA|nr:hypothetical protein PACTADRAFT_86518 [Pachysolen tannophilus NRRL Y-2460]
MTVVSKRVSIQWPPEDASEPTTTMVFTAPSDKFVDLRPLKIPQTEKEEKFPFEWAIVGYEQVLPENKIQFHHTMDSRLVNEIYYAKKNNLLLPSTEDTPDIGHFTTLPNGDKREDGEMLNIATGKIQPYIEIWRSLDLTRATPDSPIAASEQQDVPTVKCIVLEVNDDIYEGRFIIIGNWAQGILNNKKTDYNENYSSSMSCIRVYFRNNKWEPLVEYGIDIEKFPVGFTGKIGDYQGIWKCIELS